MTNLAKKILRALISLYQKIDQSLIKGSSYPKAIVLIYHRIADLPSDPLSLAISMNTFESHLVALKEKFEMVSVPELIERLKTKTLKGTECVITFDDGYRDNMTAALPIAEKYSVPITIFISTTIFDNPAPFPLDASYNNGVGTYLAREDMKALAENPLVTLGAHTVHHPRLSRISSEDQQKEISESKRVLEAIIGKPVTSFAYPFGGQLDFNADTIKYLKEADYLASFTTIEKAVTPNVNLFKIPRINIQNQSSDELLQQLSKSI